MPVGTLALERGIDSHASEVKQGTFYPLAFQGELEFTGRTEKGRLWGQKHPDLDVQESDQSGGPFVGMDPEPGCDLAKSCCKLYGWQEI